MAATLKPEKQTETQSIVMSVAHEPLKRPRAIQPPGVVFDEGLLAWAQCASSFLLFLNCWGIVNTFGTYQTIYKETILSDQDPSAISWIGSIQACLLISVGIVAGPLFDHGHLRALLGFGTLAVTLGMMMTSFCETYWQLVLAQGIVVGLGFGSLFVPSVSIIPGYFAKKKALAQGIAASGSSVGGVVYPILLQHLQARIGLAWATRVIGFLALVTLLFPLAVMRQRIKPPAARKMIDASALHEPAFVLFAVAMLFAFAGLYIPFFFSEIYAIQVIKLDPGFAFYLLPLLNAGSLFGRLISSAAADRMGALNVFILCMIVSVAVAFSWAAISSMGGVITFCLLYGFFSGSFASLSPTIIFTLSPSLQVLGTRIGMVSYWMSAGLLIGNPIAGAILNHGWLPLQMFCGVTIAISGLLVIAARFVKLGYSPSVET